MDNFSNIWMTDICNELNRAGYKMPDYKGGGNFDLKLIDGPVDLMKSYVTYSASMYDHLNSKGLINRGFCPITGDKIGTAYLYQLFGRKVYVSEKGQEIAKEWDRQEHIRLTGKEPMSQVQKNEIYENVRSEKRYTMLFFIVLILGVIYLIKKC